MKRPIRTALLAATLGVAFAASAHARIGETYAQIVARFGEPIYKNAESQSVMWKFETLFYHVVIDEKTVSVAESIAPVDKLEKITDTQQEKFLQSHLLNGQTWEPVELTLLSDPVLFGEVSFAGNPITDTLLLSKDKKLLAYISKITGKGIWVYSQKGAAMLMGHKMKEEEKSAVKF